MEPGDSDDIDTDAMLLEAKLDLFEASKEEGRNYIEQLQRSCNTINNKIALLTVERDRMAGELKDLLSKKN